MTNTLQDHNELPLQPASSRPRQAIRGLHGEGAAYGGPPHEDSQHTSQHAGVWGLTSQHTQHAVLASEHASLDTTFKATLNQGIHGMCFSPYKEGQQPGSQVDEHQIRERLTIVRPHTRWVRTFSCTDGHEQTPRIAREMGLSTLVGAWLGTDRDINAREVAGAIAVAQAGHADIVAVGNEVLLREDMSEDELLGYIRQVKSALPGVAVGYVDAYYLFELHPRITAECDVVMTNCYPFWEGCPSEQALPYMKTMLERTRAAAPGKRVLISETGWPDQGTPFGGAVPGIDAAKKYFTDTAAWAAEEGIEWFHFAAFDEAWKVDVEGDVGAFWGLWDKDAQPKFILNPTTATTK